MSLLSYKNQESSSKLLQLLKGNGYLQKKTRQIKKVRSAYVSASTNVIMKLAEKMSMCLFIVILHPGRNDGLCFLVLA